MTASSVLPPESSQDWSACYRFDSKKGVTSVYTLPGQAKLADFRTGLRGIDFRSGPQAIEAGLAYTRRRPTPTRLQDEHRSGATREVLPSQNIQTIDAEVAQADHHHHDKSFYKVLAWVNAPENVIGTGLSQADIENKLLLHPEAESALLSDASAIELHAVVEKPSYSNGHDNNGEEGDTDMEGNASDDGADGDEDDYVEDNGYDEGDEDGYDYGGYDDNEDDDDGDSSLLVPKPVDLDNHLHVEASTQDVPPGQPLASLSTAPSVGQLRRAPQRPFLLHPPAQANSEQSEHSPEFVSNPEHDSMHTHPLKSHDSSFKRPSVKDSDESLIEKEQYDEGTTSEVDTGIPLPDVTVELLPKEQELAGAGNDHNNGKQTKITSPSIPPSPISLLPKAAYMDETFPKGKETGAKKLTVPRPSILRNPSSVFPDAAWKPGSTVNGEETQDERHVTTRHPILCNASSVFPTNPYMPDSFAEDAENRGENLNVPRPSILRNSSSVNLGAPLVSKSTVEGEETKKVTFGRDLAPETSPSEGTSAKSPITRVDQSDLSTEASASSWENENSVPITRSIPPILSPQLPKASRAPPAVSVEAKTSDGSLPKKASASMQGQRNVNEPPIKRHEPASQSSQNSSRGSRGKRGVRKARQQRPDIPPRAPSPVQELPYRSNIAGDRPIPSSARKSYTRPQSVAPSNLPPEAFAQPTSEESIILDCVNGQWVEGLRYSSKVVMPLWPDIEITSLGCSKVTRALRTCRESTVYKDLRKIIWRFHLDLEDLNKRRQAHWLPLVDNCIALVQRMMDDLGRPYTFRDRWDRNRYGRILGEPQGREPGTIFYMFAVSVQAMETGSLYAEEAKSALQTISLRSNEQIQAALTGDPIAIDMQERHAQLRDSIGYIIKYFTTLAECTQKHSLLVSMTHMVREEVPRLLTKVDDADGQQLIEDAAIRTDLTAWLDGLLQKSLRQWELLPSKSAYEDSLKCFRNLDRVWQEEGPNFGLLRSMFCLGIFLPRDQRTKLVGWHFIDYDPAMSSNPHPLEGDTEGRVSPVRKQGKANQRCLPVRKMRATARSSLYRFLDIFTSREAEDDVDSVERLDQYRQKNARETGTTVQERSGHERPGAHLLPRAHGIREATLIEEQRLASRVGAELWAPFDIKTAMILIGVTHEPAYRKALLDMTEDRLLLWAKQSSPPSAAALDLLLSQLPPRARSAESVKDVEWQVLRDYMYFLDTKILRIEQLWQVYAEALLQLGSDDLAIQAEQAYKAIYKRSP